MVVKISLIQNYPLLLLLFTQFWIEIQIRSRFKIELEIQSSLHTVTIPIKVTPPKIVAEMEIKIEFKSPDPEGAAEFD